MEKMRVVVTGGTGLIGTPLTQALFDRGDDVVILTRGAPKTVRKHEKGDNKIELATWTPEKAGDWMKIIDGADAVVHLAGASVADERWTPERKALLRSSRIESTKLLTKAITKATKKPSVFVSVSGVGHYGMKAGDKILTEADPVGDDFLALLTDEWEKEALAAKEQAGTRVCIARIGLVLGKGGGVYGTLEPIFKAFVGGPVGDGKQFMPWIHLRDTVRALEWLIDHPDQEGLFNVVGPEPVTMNVFAKQFAESLHRPAIMRVPKFAIKIVMGGEAAEVVLTGQRALPKRLTDAGFAFVFADLRSALADLAAPAPK
jgi:uncharacterized protein